MDINNKKRYSNCDGKVEKVLFHPADGDSGCILNVQYSDTEMRILRDEVSRTEGNYRLITAKISQLEPTKILLERRMKEAVKREDNEVATAIILEGRKLKKEAKTLELTGNASAAAYEYAINELKRAEEANVLGQERYSDCLQTENARKLIIADKGFDLKEIQAVEQTKQTVEQTKMQATRAKAGESYIIYAIIGVAVIGAGIYIVKFNK